MKTTKRSWTRWAPLLALTALLAACGAAVAPEPAATRAPEPGPAPGPAPNPEPEPAQASCEDSAIRLRDGGAGFHGAIVADTLHWGGATAPATCTYPTAQPLADGASNADGRTAQVQQSRYYLIVVGYAGGNRLYVLSRRADGTRCVVDTNDECIARVTDLPDDFDLEELSEDVEPTIPAGRLASPTVGPAPGDDDTPAPSPAPGDGAPPPSTGTAPGEASMPQPLDGARAIPYDAVPLLTWAAAPRALSYDVYWGTGSALAGRPINTSSTFLKIASSADLAHETAYSWRVDAKNETGTTKGPEWSYVTALAPIPPSGGPPPQRPLRIPRAASNPQPRDGATGVTVSWPVLSWDAGPRADGFNLYWDTQRDFSGDSDPSKPTVRGVASTHTTYMRIGHGAGFNALEPETVYYWYVVVVSGDAKARGPVWSFTTGSGPASPDDRPRRPGFSSPEDDPNRNP